MSLRYKLLVGGALVQVLVVALLVWSTVRVTEQTLLAQIT